MNMIESWPTRSRLDEMQKTAETVRESVYVKMQRYAASDPRYYDAALEFTVANEMVWLVNLVRRAGLAGTDVASSTNTENPPA